MKKNLFFLAFLCMVIFAQAQNIENQKQFILGNISEKNAVITSSSKLPEPDNDLLALSLEFCINSQPIMQNSQEIKNLLITSLKSFNDSVPDDFLPLLLKVYEAYPSQDVIIPLLYVVSNVSVTDQKIIQDMYSIVREETQKHFSQRSNELIMASLTALSSIRDADLFTNLFPCLLMDLDEEINTFIFSSLSQSIQHYKADSIKVIAGGSIQEKRLVFDLAEKSSVSDDFFKAEIAENTLSSTINTAEDAAVISREIIDLQLDSMRVIKNAKWTRASLLITKYFSLAQNQYAESLLSRDEIIEIIECLTALATNETGKALSDYLGILNDMTEKNGTYDEVLLLSVIRSLGKLGEKSAFDNLLYVILYQGYSDTIINASKEALAKLNW